jgi:hypothetical protein
MQSEKPHRGWYERGYLPHFDEAGVPQFVTYRLADSLPRRAIETLRHCLTKLSSEEQSKAMEATIRRWLDRGYGECILKNPRIASTVIENLKHFHERRYILHEWVVMPNHVHVLVTQLKGF